MSQQAELTEAIFFFGNAGICKEMRFAEFEAVLDNVVGIPDFASQEVKAVYLTITPDLYIQSCVLFNIEFNSKGQADKDWNIPLQHLAENGGAGPDLGRGPIRLACRSQCSVSWYQRELWEPRISEGLNHFVALRDSVKRNKLGLVAPTPKSEDISTSWSLNAPTQSSAAQTNALANVQKMQEELAAKDKASEQKVSQLVARQKQLLEKMEAKRLGEFEQIKRVMRNESQVSKNTIAQLQQKINQLEVLNEKGVEKNSALLQEVAELSSKYDSTKEKLESLKDDHLAILKIQTQQQDSESEEFNQIKSELAAVKKELSHSMAREESLEADLSTLTQQFDESEEVDGELYQQLVEQDLVFVAYHAGAGHLSLPARSLQDYLKNPIMFAAQKCAVRQEDYKLWLVHYESPACQECGEPIDRVDHPSDFIQSSSAYCKQHQKTGDNVAHFRKSG